MRERDSETVFRVGICLKILAFCAFVANTGCFFFPSNFF